MSWCDVPGRLMPEMGYKEINKIIYTRCDISGRQNDTQLEMAPAPILSHQLSNTAQII